MSEYQTNNDVQHKINYLLTNPPQIQHNIQSKINFLLKHIKPVPPVYRKYSSFYWNYDTGFPLLQEL